MPQKYWTANLEEAKTWLAKLVLAEPPDDPQRPDVVALASVRRFYFEHHASKIRSVNAAKRAFVLLNEYLRSAETGEAPKVGDLTLARQHGFMVWCRDKHALSAKTISTYLSTIKAAVRFAAKPRLVRDARGREREAKVLSIVPYINDSEEDVTKVTGLVRSKPRAWIPTDGELAAVISQCDGDDLEHVFRYLIIALNTWARPEAICQLSVKTQVNFERGTIDMNPPGRVQNKKVRPLIRLTDNLRGWLLHWDLDYPILYKGKAARKIDNRTLAKAAKRSGITEAFTRYTLRHYMATRVRSVDAIQVSREERAAWMGHVDPHHRTTEAWYESQDPDYLVSAARATDAIMVRLDQLSRKTLFSPNSRPTAGLTLLKSQVK